MSDKKNPLKRSQPPNSDDEWIYLFDGIEKAHLSWIVTAPIVAVVKNWKGLLVVVAVVLGLNSPRIIDAIEAILGAAK